MHKVFSQYYVDTDAELKILNTYSRQRGLYSSFFDFGRLYFIVCMSMTAQIKRRPPGFKVVSCTLCGNDRTELPT